MPVQRVKGSDKRSGKCKLAVSGEFNIYFAQSLKEEIVELIDGYSTIEMDLSAVEEFDSTGVQLLLAMQAYLKKEERSLAVVNPSDAVASLLATYQLEEAIAA